MTPQQYLRSLGYSKQGPEVGATTTWLMPPAQIKKTYTRAGAAGILSKGGSFYPIGAKANDGWHVVV